MERGRFDSSEFSQRAFYAVKELASLRAKVNQIGITTIEIGSGGGKQLAVTSKTADLLKKNLGAQKSAFGSIEGKLSTISLRNTFQFVVYDALADRPVNCFMPEAKFREAHSAFGKRVSVFGMVQYDRDGKPLSIKVDTIRVFRDLSELPPISSFLGILKSA
jgi:hypothetical protein